MKKVILFVALIICCSWQIVSAQKTITGIVTDARDGSTLPGVSIAIKGTTSGTMSDASGNFSIKASVNQILQFSFIGYDTQEVTVGSQAAINITLVQKVAMMDEVVVIGYGTQKKINLTGAVENVSLKDVASRPLSNVSVAMQGKVSGVYITQNSGQPGRDVGTILIRGIGTLNNTNPLVLIDGVAGSMNDVNPNDVETISVLKDAASCAIYGNRAANGVILITTRRAQKDKMTVEYNFYQAIQNPTYLPDVLSSYEHAFLYNEAALNSGKPIKYTDADIQKYKDGGDPLYPNTSWQDVWYSPASMQSHYLRASGGSENVAFSVSGGYLNQDGVLMGTNFKRYNIRTNFDSYYLKNKKLHVGGNVAGVRSNRIEAPYGTTGVIRAINRDIPTEIVEYPDGSYGADRNYAFYKLGGYSGTLNTNVSGLFNADYEILKGFKAEVNYGIDWIHYMYTNYYPDGSYYGTMQSYVNEAPTSIYSELTKTTYERMYTTLNALLKYDFTAGIHSFNIMGGYSEESVKDDNLSAYRKALLSTQPEINIGDVSTQTNEGGASILGLRSFFGRLNYSLYNKYLFEANIRYDGSSRFAKDLRYGAFPSFSAGWRLSEESFMKGITAISNLKIRASWGQLGNQNINTLYAASDILSTGSNYVFDGIYYPGVSINLLANKNTTWENSTQTNVGFDLGLFNKFDISANYYKKNTTDILMQLPIPVTMGNVTPPYQNVGAMENSGWELSLNYADTYVSDLHFDASLNLSHFKNKVTDLAGVGPIYDGYTITKEGEEYGAFYGYEVEGIFQSQDEIDQAPVHTDFAPGNLKPGDIRFKDQNGDGQVDLDSDRVVIGSRIPKLLYSLQLNADYKGFDLRAFFQGVYGISAYSSLELVSPFFNGASGGKWLLDRWTPENKSTTNQRVFLDGKRGGIASTYYLENAGYLRLKNIEFGYTLPNKLVNKAGISKFRVYLSVQNAFTITKYKGFDPEKPAGQYRSDAHPQVMITSLGITLNL